ncbi:MAG: hypothetical protein JO159_19295, partial [Acidobacteria bacterium]|nr:hypothetical protein [Acidobacteriota bacterium]
PTYGSMYYPAQGLFLAFGQVVLGHPFWGVWLSAGLMFAAICWMLQGWVTPFWALLGGVLATIRLGAFSYWMNSFWGGAVAAFGGALVLGALPRMGRRPRLAYALLMGSGFALVANSRPYEGLIFSIPVLAALFLRMRVPPAPSFRICLYKLILPLFICFIITLGAMGYYFWRTTGSPFVSPYLVNARTYFPAPFFAWQVPRIAPVYHHAVMANFYRGWIMQQYEFARHHPFLLVLVRGIVTWFFFIGPLLTLPFLIICFVVPYGTSFRSLKYRTKFFLILSGAVLLAAMLPIGFDPHYIAPATGAFYVLLVIAIETMRKWRPRNRPAGVRLVRAVPIIATLMLVLRAYLPSAATAEGPLHLATWYAPVVFNTYRAKILSQLGGIPGRHLVIVRYSPDHVTNNEWVYNAADIGNSKVVWARDMGEQKNSQLIAYFKDRKVWLIEPDMIPPTLFPYTGNPDASNTALQDLTAKKVR